jgi:hypothetical protein
MGSWDCYCAICGGPFCESSVAQNPRSSRFLRRHGLSQQASSSQAESDRSTGDDHGDAEVETDDHEATGAASSQEETEEDRKEDGSFDPDVISQRRTAWMEDLHVLCRGTDAQTGEKM